MADKVHRVLQQIRQQQLQPSDTQLAESKNNDKERILLEKKYDIIFRSLRLLDYELHSLLEKLNIQNQTHVS